VNAGPVWTTTWSKTGHSKEGSHAFAKGLCPLWQRIGHRLSPNVPIGMGADENCDIFFPVRSQSGPSWGWIHSRIDMRKEKQRFRIAKVSLGLAKATEADLALHLRPAHKSKESRISPSRVDSEKVPENLPQATRNRLYLSEPANKLMVMQL
jgi:hypothetical protein